MASHPQCGRIEAMINMSRAAALVLAASIAVSLQPLVTEAADIYHGRGSIKDDSIPVRMGPYAGPCYLRADVGSSLSGDPSLSWPAAAGGAARGDKVDNVEIRSTYVFEGGAGCSSRGWRGEAMLGYRGSRKIEGEPLIWAPPNAAAPDPLQTRVSTYSLMLNGYRDLAGWGNLTPYIGAGLGLAYHVVDAVSFTQPANPMEIDGARGVSFAWQLMAGIGYRLSDQATLDVGYRYADMGRAASGRADSGGGIHPHVSIDDITAHELKLGVRYQFGSDYRGYAVK